MDTSAQHTQSIIEQFGKQAAYFAKLPGHAEATQLLINLAGVTASAEVLDIACGAGAVARPAASIAKHVTGIDLTPEMIEQAKLLQAEQGLLNLTWHLGDVTRLPFAPNTFDSVLTRYSFHHFLHPAGVLAEMVRVCKPGGRPGLAGRHDNGLRPDGETTRPIACSRADRSRVAESISSGGASEHPSSRLSVRVRA